MKKHFIYLILVILVVGFTSCESCVRSSSKKATKIGMSVIEGIADAFEEKGEKLAEKTTDIAGKIALGVGKSLDRQLNEHATDILNVTGRTAVQAIDGLSEGLNEELKTHYTEIPYTTDFVSGVSLNYIGQFKNHPVIDAYFIIPEKGTYLSKFECYDNENQLFLTKVIDIDNTLEIGGKTNTLVSFGLNEVEEAGFKNIKTIKITVTKK